MFIQAATSPNGRLEPWVARLPQIVVWVLVAALAAQAAYTVAGLAGARDVTPQMNLPTPPAPRPPPKADVASISQAKLFGTAAAARQSADNAPTTSMALVLTGTVAADTDGRGVAILGPNATSTRVYRVGDQVPGGAKLHAIYADRVLLDRGGAIEALALPRQLKPSAPAPARVASAPQPSAAVERVQQVIRDNPGIIGDIMRPQAVIVQGQQRGIRVFPGPNREAFTRLGLRPGDIVTAINGSPLDAPSRSTEIFGTLSSAASARVSVMRNGRQEEVTLNLAQVAEEAERLRAESQSQANQVPPPPVSEPPER